MKLNKRLTPQEFEALRPHLDRLGERNVLAAYAIMVEGRKQIQVAAEMGVSRGFVSSVVCRIWEAHMEHGIRPQGWVNLNVVLPPEMAEVVIFMVRKARERENERLPSPVEKADL